MEHDWYSLARLMEQYTPAPAEPNEGPAAGSAAAGMRSKPSQPQAQDSQVTSSSAPSSGHSGSGMDGDVSRDLWLWIIAEVEKAKGVSKKSFKRLEEMAAVKLTFANWEA